MGYIYLRTNRINGKKYVGQATNLEVRQRAWNCLTQPYAGPAINAARAKYGIDAFDFEILKECEDEELDYWEKYYIKELNTKAPYGYNLTEGGGGISGYTLSEETRKKISEAQKGKHHSEETRKKLSECHKGKTTWMKGKHHSEDSKIKMSEAHKGKTTWMKGKHFSDEHKKKLSEAHKGKHFSDEHKRKISDTNKNGKLAKPVLQIDKNTNEIIAEFPSIIEVQRQLGISISNISECCKGKRKTAYGFKWQYK